MTVFARNLANFSLGIATPHCNKPALKQISLILQRAFVDLPSRGQGDPARTVVDLEALGLG
ncbi:hypothetical protein [Microvirga alba]|uniref:Uncharacterized protein n=1 Tax=Microvirga alba TaxID=2791025 RepID=A0A931BNT0_9HYPH|nr:hypothetical protein [Microvirga alba]MBF9234221.1 hypothetical protein [Microvirga alba]